MTFSDNYDTISSVETIIFCGHNWIKIPGNHEVKSTSTDFHIYEGYLSNDKIGCLFITANAFRILKDKSDIHYKVISLIYEQCFSSKLIAIGENEQDLQKILASKEGNIAYTIDTLLKMFPSNFMEIQHRSLLSLYKKYPNYGQLIKNIEEFHFFAKDNTELGFILDSLITKNLLEGGVLWNGDGTMRPKGPFKIAIQGWHEIEKSLHKVYSNQIFIAMDFDKSFDPVRNSIKKAINDAGFIPIVIDEIEHINYIPLEIQNKIKNCAFIVAELTTQNNGVYFEAGYAMGQNIPVIWCCRDKDKKLHFDISQYNNILWDNEDDLYQRLKRRLIALKGNMD
jgi:hypothetical protein